MTFFLKLLSDGTNISCGRFMALMSLLLGALIAIITVYLNRDLGAASPVIGIFVGSAFGGHVVGKYMERNDGK